MAQALDQWQHQVALSEVPDVLHWTMYPTLYRCTCMAIDIASDLPAFFVFADYLFAHILS